ncbi:MAG: N-acetylmuramoyl-L-alanine amidase [Bacteroidales bacterium]|nr:N-acetylmuramoyl-L-alanine amidase [Bacteroidales bacterium]
MKRIIAIFIVLLVAAGPVFSQKKETYRVRTVVIDPGHGGAKPGAQGKRSQEKAITLSVAKKFGKLIEDNYPDVKVIYTRTTDVDISLAERAHIANRNKADLFISIHANSHPTSTPTGVETFVMGLSESRANLEVAKKENADILLEADYKNNADYSGFDPNAPETYVMLTMFQNAFIDKSLNLAQAIQNQYKQNIKTVNRGVKQAELYVLYKTTCPSVLTEIGFISNPTEENYMLSDEGQAKIAVCLFNAFMTYKATEEGTDRIANPVINLKGWKQAGAKEEPKPAEPPVVKEEPKPAESTPEPVAAAPKPEPVAVEKPAELQPAAEEPKVLPVEDAPVVEVKPAQKPTPSAQLPVVKTPEAQPEQPKPQVEQPKAEPKQEQPKQQTQPATTSGVRYRVQFCTATREMKVGDPDLQGIKDFHVARSGKFYMYTAGDYTSVAEARQRCKKIKEGTRFKDAFVVAIYKGERITMERAAQIENANKKVK